MSSNNDNSSERSTKKQKGVSLLPEKYKSLSQWLKDKLILLMENDSKIKMLSLGQCNIGHLGAQAVADVLKQNNTLTYLRLNSNNIGLLGAQALTDALYQNNTLTNLHLSCNKIGDLGAQALANALYQNNTLSYLELYGNQIRDLGAQALANALYQNNTLSYLGLGDNHIGDLCKQALSTAKASQKIRITIGTAPYSLFPHILEKCQNDPSVVCWVLQNYPFIIPSNK